MTTQIAGIEGGGTKFLAAIAEPSDDGPPVIVDRLRVDTTASPTETVTPIREWLAGFEYTALGVAMFGPIDLTAGVMLATPKAGWEGADMIELLNADAPLHLDTDVNAAGLAEWRWGAAAGTHVALYVTVGTGIGGGLIVGGNPMRGAAHPEMGHVPIPRHDDIPSTCPHHESCLEGLAAGPALQLRAGGDLAATDADHPVWSHAVTSLAHGLFTLTVAMAPDVIVLGGGVSEHDGLRSGVADRLDDLLAGYVPTPPVVAPRLGQEAGLYGALALAEEAPDA